MKNIVVRLLFAAAFAAWTSAAALAVSSELTSLVIKVI